MNCTKNNNNSRTKLFAFWLLIVVGESPEASYTVTVHLNKTNKSGLLEQQIGLDKEKGTVTASLVILKISKHPVCR